MTATDGAMELHAERTGKRHTVTLRHDGRVICLDTFDLRSAGARRRFVEAAVGKCPDVNPDGLDAELLEWAADPEPPSPPAGEYRNRTAEQLADTPPDVLAEAEAVLADPNLVGRVADAVAAAGVAGERELGLTLYLLGTSRLLPGPLAGIVQGTSSSGKSYTVDRVADLFPPEAVIRATQMTPQALFHMPPGGLRHKWVVAGERSRLENDDTAEATRALREMLSGQRLSKLMPVKGAGGIETQLIEQEGPIAFTETTTLGRVFEEDANRCLLLQTDETPEQTRRILRELARRQAAPAAPDRRVLGVHHAVQRLLPSTRVAVPWAERLGELFDPSRVEVRRAFPQLLALVQASALLHFRQRSRGADGCLLADANDYRLARRLIRRPFAQSLGGGLPRSALDLLGDLRTLGGADFTVSGAARQFRKNRSSVHNWVARLQDAGAVEEVEAGKGSRAARFRVTGRDPEPGDVLLPTAEELFGEAAGRADTTHSHRDS
jgi:hypothetical protein